MMRSNKLHAMLIASGMHILKARMHVHMCRNTLLDRWWNNMTTFITREDAIGAPTLSLPPVHTIAFTHHEQKWLEMTRRLLGGMHACMTF